MTGREKIEAAFSAGGARETAAVICYEGIYVRDHWSAITDCPWWYAQSPEIDHQFEWRRDAIDKTGQDWFVLPPVPERETRANLRIDVKGGAVFLVDRSEHSRERLAPPVVGGWGTGCGEGSVRPEAPADTVEKIDAEIPLPAPLDARAFRASGRADLADRMLEAYGRKLWPFAHVSGPVWQLYGLWGFEGMMINIASRADLVRYACERTLARSIHGVRVAAELGAAGIWIEECLTDLMSPRAFAELNAPLVRRLCDEIRRSGMKSIYYYCGDPAGKWDEILSIGADAVAFEESKKGFVIDIGNVVERANGRAVVFGNLDAIGLLPKATKEELTTEIRRQIAAGRRNGSRFVMSLGSPVTPGTSIERVRRYCELTHELSS